MVIAVVYGPLVVCASAVQMTQPNPPYSSVAMAGTFNGWNPGGGRYTMDTVARDVWVFEGTFPAGEHKFKFVMDGSWTVHRGEKSPGILEQPGRDIVLAFAASQKVRIRVDASADTWDMKLLAAGDISAPRKIRRAPPPSFPTPDWAKNVVWYQIMLDRWRNADPANDPDSCVPWRWDWFKPFTPGESRAFYGGDGVWHRNYGGDLKGLSHTFDYLESLGVTGIYLNPVFEAPGHHKYNTADYRHIDDNFGTKSDIAKLGGRETGDTRTWKWTPTDTLFLEVLAQAHHRGFRVILDGVFNHSGTDFWAFRDLVKRETRSPYKDWFVVKDWNAKPARPGDPGFTYEGWAGFAGLPEYAENDRGLLPGIRAHIFDITERWMAPALFGAPNAAAGIDGWRLDVPGNVHEAFWRDWRVHVKRTNPDAYISGEIWEVARDWLDGRHFDAVMNYEFLRAVQGFFFPGGNVPALSGMDFAEAMEDLLSQYPADVNFVLQNLLGSHDVDRVASSIHNRAGFKRGRVQDDNPGYDVSPPNDTAYETLKRVVVFQMTWVGAPMIYYGDELGMFGADDPTNRMPMWWPDLMPYDNPAYRIRDDMLAHYRRMIAVRNTSPALRTGGMRFVASDPVRRVVAFERSDGMDTILVVVNADTSPVKIRIPLPRSTRRLVDLLDPLSAYIERGWVEGIGSHRNILRIRKDAPFVRAAGAKTVLKLAPGESRVYLIR